jgi:aldose sugar dehydrogenase
MFRLRIQFVALAALLFCTACPPDNTANREAPIPVANANAPQPGEREDLVEGLETPWGIDFLPDGRMIFTERGGRVSVLENGERLTVGQAASREVGEGGLHGVAVDPDFDRNSFVYLYYTTGQDNRVTRFVLRDNRLEDERVIIEGIPRARIHNGGRIRFGPDAMLYIATGDAAEPRLSQDRDSLAGKILRLNRDGSVPEDNPFGNPVWAYGLRNPQGFDWHPATGELYAASHGPTRRDEVNRIERGGNYGWPRTCDQRGDFIPAVRCYTEFTLAPAAVAFIGDDLYVAGLRGTQVRRLRIGDGKVVEEEQFLSGMGRIREVIERDGWLYVSTSNRDGRGRPRRGDDRIFRLRPEPEVVSFRYGVLP